MWIGIVIGGCIALYLLVQVAVILLAIGLSFFVFLCGLIGIRKETKRAKARRAVHTGRRPRSW
jgi:hypothetical protein